MPAHKLPTGETAQTEAASAYSIVGMYSEPTDGEFVRHVAILADDSELEFGQPAAVWHMGPPLEGGARLKSVHLVGSMPLDLDDVEGIHDWLEDVLKDPPPNPFKRYVVRPHCDWHIAPESGRALYRRFSCAGFVLECYRSIGIDLVNTDERDLPDVDFDMLVKAYPEIEKERVLARRGLSRDDLGIGGNGPWRLVLAGYVFHALDKITEEDPRSDPYTPETATEAYFRGPSPSRGG